MGLKRSKKRTRKAKKLTQTALLKKFEPEMRDLIIQRDGGKCQIEGYRHKCAGRLVADHRPASRGKHSTFLNPMNLTTVCMSANFLAQLDPFVSNEIIRKVREREGENIITELEAISRTTKKWDEFSIRKHIDDCKRWFLKNRCGAPK